MDNKINGTVERILQFIEYKGISKREFSSSIGISHSLIGKSPSIGSDKLEKILLEYPELNPAWLLSGKGNMIVNSIIQDVQGEIAGRLQEKEEKLDNNISISGDVYDMFDDESRDFMKAAYWFAIRSYASKFNVSISENMFGELSAIYKSIGNHFQRLQDFIFFDVAASMSKAIINKVEKDFDIHDHIFTDDEVQEQYKIIDKYVSLFNDVSKHEENLPLILSTITVFLKAKRENKKKQSSN